MDFVGKSRWFFLLSLLIMAAGMVSIAIPPGFRVGIEFTGGSALSITFAEPVQQTRLRTLLTELGHEEALIQRLGDTGFLIRTRTLTEGSLDGNIPSERFNIENSIENTLGPIEISDLSAVSPIIAGETVRNAIIAILFAAVAILLYITWAFRLVPHSGRMGSAAILAAVHDVIIVVGLFSILGKFTNAEINTMFITGILTVVGYSVHDTIVVFDRIRENTGRRVSRDIATTVNISIMETIGRSLTTSFTTIFVVLAILFLGGGTIQSLLLTLLIGIITGTYSSIFIASQLLVTWERHGLFGALRNRPSSGNTENEPE